MLKLVIFDFDGLMVNSEHVVFAALQALFHRHGRDFAWDYYCTTLGLPVADSLAMYLRDIPIGLTGAELRAERDALVAQYMETHLELMFGLPPLLDDLRERGVALAVATSGMRDYVTHQLERFGLTAYFAAVVCVEDVARGKPHPDLVLKTLEVTGTRADKAIMLEDAPHGVAAAHAAGVFCVAVPTQGLDWRLFDKADVLARDLWAVRRIMFGT
jgi:HAD superfamily hydrolase (TIGR01509 family)